MEVLGFSVLIIVLALIGIYLYTKRDQKRALEVLVDNTHKQEQVVLNQQVQTADEKVQDVKKDYDKSMADYIAKYGKPGSSSDKPPTSH